MDAGPCYGLGESQSDGANVTEFRKADWPLLVRRKVSAAEEAPFSSVAKVGGANDETGNALLDRAAFYSQAPRRLRGGGSDDGYPGAALLREERGKRLSGSSR